MKVICLRPITHCIETLYFIETQLKLSKEKFRKLGPGSISTAHFLMAIGYGFLQTIAKAFDDPAQTRGDSCEMVRVYFVVKLVRTYSYNRTSLTYYLRMRRYIRVVSERTAALDRCKPSTPKVSIARRLIVRDRGSCYLSSRF